MPKITKGGVSDINVDPNFIAPAGVPVERAIDEGLDNQAGTEADKRRAENEKREAEKREPAGAAEEERAESSPGTISSQGQQKPARPTKKQSGAGKTP